MADEDKNKTVFSISEEEEAPEGTAPPPEQKQESSPVETLKSEEPSGPEKPAEVGELESEEPEGKIERGYEAQSQPVLESTAAEGKKPESKGLLSSFFGSGKRNEKMEKEEEVAAEGMHLADIVRSKKEVEKKKPSVMKIPTILNFIFLIAIILLLFYSLVIVGPVKFLDRITTFPQWFPQLFEYWFEKNIYPLLGPLVEKFEGKLTY